MSEVPDQDPAKQGTADEPPAVAKPTGQEPVGQSAEGVQPPQEAPIGQPAGIVLPPRRRSWAPWIFAAAAVLVVSLVVVLVVSLTNDDGDGGTPTSVANAVVDALNNQDESSIEPLMCQSRVPNVLTHIEAQAGEVDTHARLRGVIDVTDKSATALVTIEATEQGRSEDLDFELYLQNQGSTWCAEQFAGPREYTRG